MHRPAPFSDKYRQCALLSYVCIYIIIVQAERHISLSAADIMLMGYYNNSSFPSEIFHTLIKKVPDPCEYALFFLRDSNNIACTYLYVFYLR